eukprot:gb/GEZN01002747.1/.p1 GENE.gb/GEZN01002747.1/~~gb/GEZN01002747.1/.p1  ORF type:complete len:526 (-),score=52.68 gb/GEZN01002747.1/:770-2347(-)
MKELTPTEVARHNVETDCWVIVEGKVYDVTSFLSSHPGGTKILLKQGGKDASKLFAQFHKPSVLPRFQHLIVGQIPGAVSSPATTVGQKVEQRPRHSKSSFGDLVPYGDPNWYQDYDSPYYNQSHREWRSKVRLFVENHVMPHRLEWDELGRESKECVIPASVFRKMADTGLLPGFVGPPWPAKYTKQAAPPDFDAFHELILLDEFCRCGSGGVVWGLIEGLSIGLPPILTWGSDYLKDLVASQCLSGEKFIALCISEPWSGSDVAGLKTTATRKGDTYVVNGAKKWITNGLWADYFTVAVRTGDKGARGISMLLVERDRPGVTVSKMTCMGVWASGTALITFEDVQVPVKNLIGTEGKGFSYIVSNFNHERWAFVVQANRFARVCFEEAFKYALQRETFGQKLIEHQMLRWKLAEMARQIESTQAWLEQVTFSLKTMTKEQSNQRLNGTIALMKAQSTKTFEYCAREALQIFGGEGYVRNGSAAKVECLYRDVRAWAIPGGSEEIMLDFGVRQASKDAQARAKL